MTLISEGDAPDHDCTDGIPSPYYHHIGAATRCDGCGRVWRLRREAITFRNWHRPFFAGLLDLLRGRRAIQRHASVRNFPTARARSLTRPPASRYCHTQALVPPCRKQGPAPSSCKETVMLLALSNVLPVPMSTRYRTDGTRLKARWVQWRGRAYMIHVHPA